jgi:hypothetical protein
VVGGITAVPTWEFLKRVRIEAHIAALAIAKRELHEVVDAAKVQAYRQSGAEGAHDLDARLPDVNAEIAAVLRAKGFAKVLGLRGEGLITNLTERWRRLVRDGAFTTRRAKAPDIVRPGEIRDIEPQYPGQKLSRTVTGAPARPAPTARIERLAEQARQAEIARKDEQLDRLSNPRVTPRSRRAAPLGNLSRRLVRDSDEVLGE